MKKSGLIYIVLVGILFTTFSSGWTGIDGSFTNSGLSCVSTTSSANWTNLTTAGDRQTIEVVFDSSGNVGNCSKWNKDTKINCCPTGYECNFLDNKCYQKIESECGTFKTEAACNNSNLVQKTSNPAYKYFESMGTDAKITGTSTSVFEAKCNFPDSVLLDGDDDCGKFSKCVCSWNVTSGKCYDSWVNLEICQDGSGGITEEILGICEYEVSKTTNRCSDLGKMIIEYQVSASGSAGSECSRPSNREVSCSAVVVVPFFSVFNLLASVLGIVVVYSVFGKKILKK